jgi:para-aminobenzoate synthetase/4-amino-4-deoxychorismate lyase
LKGPGVTGRPNAGRGVFDTILVKDGAPIEIDEHFARLEASVAALYRRPLPRSLRRRTETLASEAAFARLRVALVPESSTLRVDIALTPMPAELAMDHAPKSTVVESRALANGLGPHKWVDRDIIEHFEDLCAPAVPLFVDALGTILEGSRANVFVQVGDALITPPLDNRILPGITRQRVIALAGPLRIRICEEPVALSELLAGDGAFLTGSLRGITPIAECDGRPLRSAGNPSIQNLWEALRNHWHSPLDRRLARLPI